MKLKTLLGIIALIIIPVLNEIHKVPNCVKIPELIFATIVITNNVFFWIKEDKKEQRNTRQ